MSRCIFGDLATATQMREDRDFFYRCQTDSWDCWPSEYPFRRSAISAELIPSDFTWSVCHISRPLLFVDVTIANLHFDLDNSAAAVCSGRGRMSVTHKIIFYRNAGKKFKYLLNVIILLPGDIRSCQLWHIRGLQYMCDTSVGLLELIWLWHIWGTLWHIRSIKSQAQM